MRPFLILSIAGAIALLVVSSCSTDGSLSASGPEKQESETISAKGGGGGGGTTPPVTTNAATYLTSRSATVGGSINTGGSGITQRGVCFALTSNPTVANSVVVNGSGEGAFECALLNLEANTIYYARAFSVDRKKAVQYGDQVSFTTKSSYGTVTDADGNVYNTVTIGDQVWTTENLRTTKYDDGTTIPEVPGVVEWATITYGAYCYVNNQADNTSTYGLLYNFYAIEHAGDLAPNGWHVATEQDWVRLQSYLQGPFQGTVNPAQGGRMKTTGTTLWESPNDGATNAASFFAVPAGYRTASPNAPGGPTSSYVDPGNWAKWWSSTVTPYNATGWIVRWFGVSNVNSSLSSEGMIEHGKGNGFSVRLVKD